MHFQPLFILLFILLNALSANAAALHDAAKKGDKAGIAAALDGGADINEIAGLVTPPGKPAAGYYKKTMARQIYELAQTLDYKQVDIVGHHLGA